MILIDGKKYAETAYERDILGLPPSPGLIRKSESARKGGKKSRRGKAKKSPVYPGGVPPEDRGPYYGMYTRDEQGILVRKKPKKTPREQPLPSREEVFANLERQMSKEPEKK